MELAGIVGMPQEGLRPDLLNQILVKDHEASAQQPGKAIFWVLNRSQENVGLATVLAEPYGQNAEAAPDNRAPQASAGKQASITDFFSSRPSTLLPKMPVLEKGKPRGVIGEQILAKSSSSSEDELATELLGTSQAKPTETDEAETEKYWIEKDKERLAVIADMENTMAEMKEQLANTVTAFQMASDANHRLQAQLGRKRTSLSQMEEDLNEVVHDLDAADKNNEQLRIDLAHSRRDCKRQLDRAEEAMALIEEDPSKEAIASLLQAKAEAESRNLSKQREMELEIENLNSQLKERCDSMARLTENLSRVADSDRWVDVRRELNEVWERADRLPEDLQIAMRECDKWKDQFHALQDSQEEELEKTMREVRWQLNEKAVKSEQALRGCLRQVFERMVRCALCLELQGLLPFDEKHSAICDHVLKLTGEDYQQPLLEYYEEHDIQEEFEDNLEDDDEDDERVDYIDSEIQARSEEPDRQGNGQEQTEGSISNHSNGKVHTPTFSSGPADTTHDSSSSPNPATIKVDSVNTTAVGEEQVQESTQTWEALKPKKQARSNHWNTVPAPAASTNPEPSKGFTFSQPVFASEQAEVTDLSTAACEDRGDKGKAFAFVFGKNSAPPFSETPTTNIKETWIEGSMPSDPSITSKTAEEPSTSRAWKGNSEDHWGGSFISTADNDPLPRAARAADQKVRTEEKPPFFTLFLAREAAKAQKEAEAAHCKTGETSFPTHINFAGYSVPGLFIGSSSSFPARATQPASIGMFRSAPMEPKTKADQDMVAKDESAMEDVPKIEAPKETSSVEEAHMEELSDVEKPSHALPQGREAKGNELKTQISKEESVPMESLAPNSSSPSRKERRVAKKAQEKAAQKAKNEARNAKADERRHVEKAMLMK